MKILAEISEATLKIGEPEQLGTEYRLRKSARVILLNAAHEMATQYLETYKFHKLPGGGVDPGETIEEALKRETLEEVGAECKIVRSLGMVIEYRQKYKMLHISYGFVATVVGEIGEPELEPGEIEEGQTTLWLPPREVLERLRSDTGTKFEAAFIQAREIAFLEEYLAST